MIDSHHHFWKLSRNDYGWLTEQLNGIYRDFQPADMADILKRFNITKTVLVQAAPTFDETLYLIDLAASHSFITGVVGWVDMETPAGLTQLSELAKHPVVKSIRPMVQDIPDDKWLLSDAIEPAVQEIIRQQLCFDALVLPKHLTCLNEFLTRYPELKVVVDHCAKPNIADKEFEPWASQIAEIASHPQVCCKLSGLVTETGPQWKMSDLKPYVDHVMEVFGPSRVMWGSDWPVVNLAGDYDAWVDVTRLLLRDLTEPELKQVMGLTAERFYQL